MELIDKFRNKLSKKIPAQYFNNFIQPLSIYKQSQDKIILSTKSEAIKNHATNKYLSDIQETFTSIIGNDISIEIILDVPKIEPDTPTGTNKAKKNKLEKYIDQESEVVKLEKYLFDHYDFRYNELSEVTEYKNKNEKYWNDIDDRIINYIFLIARKDSRLNNRIASMDLMSKIINSPLVPSYHPIKEYYHSIQSLWKGKYEIENNKIVLKEGQDFIKKFADCFHIKNDFLEFQYLYSKWKIRNLHMLFNRNFVNEHILSYHSAQGYGKSTSIKMSVPEGLRPYFSEGVPKDIDGKDSVFLLQRCYLINLDEFDKLNKYEAGKIRAFASLSESIERKAYAVTAKKYRRSAGLILTVNKEDFLNDDTGNRRFLTVTFDRKINLNAISKMNMDLLESQFYNLYLFINSLKNRDNFIHWSEEEQIKINNNNLNYERTTTEMELIQANFQKLSLEEYNPENENHQWLRSSDIEIILKDLYPKMSISGAWIGRALSKLGYIKNKANVQSGTKPPKSYLVNRTVGR